MIERKYKRTGKIAIFAVAHGVYWEQFPGLLDNMKGFHKTLCDKVEANEVEVLDFGIVDSSEQLEDIFLAGDDTRQIKDRPCGIVGVDRHIDAVLVAGRHDRL